MCLHRQEIRLKPLDYCKTCCLQSSCPEPASCSWAETWGFCSVRRKEGKGWTTAAFGLCQPSRVWTDSQVGAPSLCITKTAVTCSPNEWPGISDQRTNSQCWSRSMDVRGTDEQRLLALPLVKKTVWLMPMANRGVSYLQWTVPGSAGTSNGSHNLLQEHKPHNCQPEGSPP